MRIAALLGLALLASLGCKSKQEAPEEGKNLTTGVVQREIRKGMSGAAVIEALGSPNIVTTDEQGREVWVYERYARDVETTSNGYFVIFAFGKRETAKGSTRSLTVVIKFDEQKKVRDFGYHASTF
jgi:outer membrane protein assembly factor BamE (lipoprotein component of BamABCDE complex)